MKGLEFVFLGIGALAGAFLRYKIASSPILLGALPINILIINVAGSFILGVFTVISSNFNLDPKYSMLIAIGFCGSFTTMSSFALESVNLFNNKQFALFFLNIIGNVALSLGAVILGRTIALGVIKI
jgi:CrcB protein